MIWKNEQTLVLLHWKNKLFLNKKRIETGIRISHENFSEYDRIKVFPIYSVSNILNNKD